MNDGFDTSGWDNDDDDLGPEFFQDLPRPLFWRVIVMPVRPKKVSAGGIHIPLTAQEAQGVVGYVGRVVALGPIAGTANRLGGSEVQNRKAEGFPRVGEYVCHGRYTGQPMIYKGVKLILCNDDELLGVAPDPSALRVHI
jgi:co-chaperonin GroES (HSP10)